MKSLHIFISLSALFLAFSFSIYLKPAFAAGQSAAVDKQKVSEGRLVWQRYNCQSCHQLYGLGGYLGPDLTNVYSAPGKGESYIRALVRTGTAQMPVFNLSEEETTLLIAFLKTADTIGSADPRDFFILSTGMTKRK